MNKEVIGDIEGRNGNFDITGILIRGRDRADGTAIVDIEGIGKRGSCIRGGITVHKKPFEEAVSKYFGATSTRLNKRELAAVLAGLRLIQRTIETDGSLELDLDDIFTDCGTVKGLDGMEIDKLCQRLNYA